MTVLGGTDPALRHRNRGRIHGPMVGIPLMCLQWLRTAREKPRRFASECHGTERHS